MFTVLKSFSGKVSGSKGHVIELKDKAIISKILLLFNVETVCSDSSEVMWFPFDKFKYNNNNKILIFLKMINLAYQKQGG